MTPTSILLVGCGRMGSALLKGWLKGFDASHIVLVDPTPDASLFEVATGLRHYGAVADVPTDINFTIVVLAVKPQIMEDILKQIPDSIKNSSPVFVSIAAGKTIDYFTKHLGAKASVIRAMPNTPALVNKGITVLCGNKNATGDQCHMAGALMKAVGNVVWIDDEKLMSAVTALSGSGPAYVFYLLEALVGAATKLGLPEKLARQLAIETVGGSAELAHESSDTFEKLRQNVVSPGGTTEAALKVLTKDQVFLSLIDETLAAGAKRSSELSN